MNEELEKCTGNDCVLMRTPVAAFCELICNLGSDLLASL